MVSPEKQFEHVTARIRQHEENRLAAFRLFIQNFSAILGGSIYLAMDRKFGVEASFAFTYLSMTAVGVLTIVASLMIVANYATWWGYRKAQTVLLDGKIPGPEQSTFQRLIEIPMIIAMFIACGTFWAFNPFTLLSS